MLLKKLRPSIACVILACAIIGTSTSSQTARSHSSLASDSAALESLPIVSKTTSVTQSHNYAFWERTLNTYIMSPYHPGSFNGRQITHGLQFTSSYVDRQDEHPCGGED